MRSQTVNRLSCFFVVLLLCNICIHAQYVETFQIIDVEKVAEYSGYQTILDKTFKREAEAEAEIAVEERSIDIEFNKLSEWKAKYNSYLKTAEGLGSALNAGYHIFYECSRLFQNLLEIRKNIQDNPEGAAASLSMRDLYVETFGELLSMYVSLENAVSAGGKLNMLSGEERLSIMWDLEKNIERLSDKLHTLAVCMRQCSFMSNWNHVLIKTIPLDKAEISRIAMEDWSKSIEAVTITSSTPSK